MLTNRELTELKWDIREYIRYGEENALSGTWIGEPENASARWHISRPEDEIARKMNTSKHNAGRLIMMEEAYFSSAAQKYCFLELGVEEYEVVATLDSHTSEICRMFDGQHFSMKDYQPGVTAPPFHVFCRSTTAPYFDENFGDIGERAARDADGKEQGQKMRGSHPR